MAAYPPCGKGASPLGAGRAPSFFLQLRSTGDQSFRCGILSAIQRIEIMFHMDLRGSAFTDFGDVVVAASEDDGGNTVITGGTETIVVHGVALNQWSAADFVFV